MTQRLIVCGTDTDVGKTVVSALLVQGLKARYWKPVQCGLEDGGDSKRVRRLLGLSEAEAEGRILPEAYRYSHPVSPHWAGELEHDLLDPSRLELPIGTAPLVVETAGGLLVPLRRDLLQIDQVRHWGLPVLLVARSGLGTLNHTLLSVEALAQRGIPLLGLVFNGPIHADNPSTLAALTGAPVLGCLPPLASLTAQTLAAAWHDSGLAASLTCNVAP
ncbi:dethiobiotin synthase [Synechococcus sp. CS-602]|uniref:dethiobiotin synthase n=1 Tax=Synechococcaceae TaxID=1890426 RepID=UPI0008FF4B68|nr:MULTISPECIES: dethiobiotin synthase [Synechococcaceae]MCT4363444.1 dethiobiotin synthase [Candidatus Regnicoccus frigidus MAG-AL1]APD48479.1 dethiobiotin synthase [Synechococcus sp. SynAce01]MCT0203256.1 dethiobiotin synthase [Synechococcus sp. CS-603]MCT0205264.1 dethiobiotin synthase [Synechococcus sp. CS-602]MCT0246758.1 dethiobiotin synthase [Synechococcus sp. CS-601]